MPTAPTTTSAPRTSHRTPPPHAPPGHQHGTDPPTGDPTARPSSGHSPAAATRAPRPTPRPTDRAQRPGHRSTPLGLHRAAPRPDSACSTRRRHGGRCVQRRHPQHGTPLRPVGTCLSIGVLSDRDVIWVVPDQESIASASCASTGRARACTRARGSRCGRRERDGVGDREPVRAGREDAGRRARLTRGHESGPTQPASA